MKVYIETHAHFYPVFDLEIFLKSFIANTKLKNSDSSVGIIFLTESSNFNYFDVFSERYRVNDFVIKRVSDYVLEFESDSKLIYFIKSKQVVTKEKIELLIVGFNYIGDGEESVKIIDSSIEKDALIILPWGFGKWNFRKKKHIKELINKYSEYDLFFLGDNVSRTVNFLSNDIFEFAKKKGIRVLNGSDPLPFKGEDKYVGKFYVELIINEFNKNYPYESLKNILRKKDSIVKNLGRRDNLYTFIKRQLKINLKKYFR